MQLVFSAQKNSQHIQLDSILIENISQGGDTTLFSPDTILVLDYIIGVTNAQSVETKDFNISQNYPNPIVGKSNFFIRMPKKGNIRIVVCDLTGRELLHYSSTLDQGKHSFLFIPGSENFYLLTAQVNSFRKTIKMINRPSHNSNAQNCKLEYVGKKDIVPRYKSSNSKDDFVFNLGDLLIYTAYSDSGHRKISDSPTLSQIYTFQYSGIPCPGMPYVTDIEGNVYNTVRIGTQCWMKENLKTTTYKDGTPIPNVPDTSWSYITEGAYVWYDNNISWRYAYGALYNWYACVDTNGLCPEGWHVPSDDDWEILHSFQYLSGDELKSCRQVNYWYHGMCNTSVHPRWEENNLHHGYDNYGFTGLPGGTRFADGTFQQLGYYSYWWTSSEWYTGEEGMFWYLYIISNQLGSWYYSKNFGFSMRCLRNLNNLE